MLGVLGGGQLGAMFAGAARRMGYHIAVWDPDPDAPAHRLASSAFSSPFSDPLTREKFSQMVQAVTFEWENVPAELCEWLERDHPVRPASSVLRVIQDRIEQKRFFQSFNLSVPPFVVLQSAGDLASAIKTLGLPAICKTAKTGYDGKGQWIIRAMSETAQVEAASRSGNRACDGFLNRSSNLSVNSQSSSCEARTGNAGLILSLKTGMSRASCVDVGSVLHFLGCGSTGGRAGHSCRRGIERHRRLLRRTLSASGR